MRKRSSFNKIVMMGCLLGSAVLMGLGAIAQESETAPAPAEAEEVIDVVPQSTAAEKKPAAEPEKKAEAEAKPEESSPKIAGPEEVENEIAETKEAEESDDTDEAKEPSKSDEREAKKIEEKLKLLSEEAVGEPKQVKEGNGPIYVIPVKTAISGATHSFMRRVIKNAQKADARAIILDVDTPGGELDACLEIIEMLNKLEVPTFTYVNNKAISAGSLIAIGTGDIYMAPLSAIGASAVVGGQGEDLGKTMNDKVVSILSAFMRTTAQRNGHNPHIVEAFINKEVEVKVGDTLVNPKGTLLSLGANEAAKIIDGKPVLAAGIVDNIDALIEQAGMTGKSKVIYEEPTGFEHIGSFLSLIAPLLLIVGLASAYLEFQAPGFGIAGAISIIAFSLYFFGHYVVGLAGSELMILFLLGVVLVLFELLVMPGTLIPLLAGILLMVISLFLAMVDVWPSTDGSWLPDFGDITMPAIKFMVGMGGSVVLIAIMATFLPKTPLFGRLALADAITGTALTGLENDPEAGSSSGASATRVRLGMDGVAESRLRPSGKARFGELLVDVQSDGRFVEKGTPVKITGIHGATVTVEPL